ncbi:NAD(P)/FAD-dependent oxidoreductase [Nocardia sp. NPDC051570]|uniref:NAD(P)/FAD-dependent oxidoreductase n=1 Tax=Nocardia sp. NPDC051570 TaxID=3364324 RepID=UPI0037B49755
MIGAGIGGLLAARVMSEFFVDVTVVEHDILPDDASLRRRIPQGAHAHALLGRGLNSLEELFPGFTREMVDHGASIGDALTDFRIVFDDHFVAHSTSGIQVITASRSLLEWRLRNRVESIDNVEIIDRCAAVDIIVNPHSRAVAGLAVSRGSGAVEVIAADMIVDASGRGSQTQSWLEKRGFPRPRKVELNIQLGYATRHFRRESAHLEGDLAVLVGARPNNPRAGSISAQEGDRWVVTLGGYFHDAPPMDPSGFYEFAATLGVPALTEILTTAMPLDEEAARYRIPAAVRRFYDADDLPEGYIPLGDTVCCFNPIYAQGMSVAAAEAIFLRQCLHRSTSGLTRRYLRKITTIVDVAWAVASTADLRLPCVEGARTRRGRIATAYICRIYAAAAADPYVGAAFGRVTNLVAHPATLISPRMLFRVWRGSRRSAESAS